MRSNGLHANAVELESVSKRYLLDPEHPMKLKDIARPLSLVRKVRAKDPFWALRDITLSVPEGQILGIIGHNGSGKSTLLKILARITEPTTGEVELRGRVGSLLEVGTGFHGELSGRENIYLNGAILGMRRREIQRKFDEIVDFAGVAQFIDTPVKHYSSGMYMRLAFAVAAHMETEILLVDEVLAVGDADFQEKCFEHFGALRERNTTIIIVTHNVDSLMDFADRVIMLDHGRIKLDGGPFDVVTEYLSILRQQSPALERVFQRSLLGYRQQMAAEAAAQEAP
jgi:lipopolysaccharide transport system ATP-binding protein